MSARYLRVVALGDSIVPLREEELLPDTRIPGCTSISHLEVTLKTDSTISLRGYSDARVSRGLLALLIVGLDGQPAAEVLKISAEEILAESGLIGTLGPTRTSGVSNILHALQARIRDLVLSRSKTSEEKEGSLLQPHPLEGRWSDRQGPDAAVLLSGGVDSSVALHLALEQGYRVHAFYLKIWLEDELSHLGECPWEEDIFYARAVCKQANVQLEEVGLQREYWDQVVQYTMAEAKRGRTPNPDVMCNSRIKFGAFYEHIGQEFDAIVTGHYARVRNGGMGKELWVSKDLFKDQTYFLAHLEQRQLEKVLFPVGEYSKAEVREMAKRLELANMGRKDSQGICFLGKVKFDDFLGYHLGEQRGSLVEYETGRELGHHKGFWFFTLGQRRGVGLSGGPWYVVSKDVERNVVYVSKDYNNVNKDRREFEFDDVVWIGGCWPDELQIVGDTNRMRLKVRHGERFHEGEVERMGGGKGRVLLDERDKGLAPGQFCAFYDYAGRCLGSGIICSDAALEMAPASIHEMDSSSVRLQAHA